MCVFRVFIPIIIHNDNDNNDDTLYADPNVNPTTSDLS